MKRSTLFTALFVAFIDFFGVGLVYPLFSSMLFDSSYGILAENSSTIVRGMWLGLLVALMPLAQFFFAPLWGALSDNLGRKKPLQWSLVLILLGYIFAVFGVHVKSLILLLLSRLIIGIASGNTSIVQAAIADLSSPAQKTKNFGLYTMALGLGFSLGPFLGGLFSSHSYSTPFIFAAFITLLNTLFTFFFFEETRVVKSTKKLHISSGLSELFQAFQVTSMRQVLFASFFYSFGWSYFFEFAPVYLIDRFDFSSTELGLFYGVAGGFYALSTGLLIRPIANRMKASHLFFGGIFLAALMILIMPLVPTTTLLWPFIFLHCFFVSFVTPSAITLISDQADSDTQGTALGNLNAVNSAAYVLSPLLAGTFVGLNSALPLWLGGVIMIMAALLFIPQLRLKVQV